MIDIRSRIGWVCRMARLTAPPGSRLSQTQFAKKIGSNAARLSRLETGLIRDSALMHAYEHALGLYPYSLVAAAGLTLRSFPGEVSRDLGPLPSDGLEASRNLDVLLASPSPPAETWLKLAIPISQGSIVAIPTATAHELFTRLLGEIGRCVGPGQAVRYEAAALLRSSPVGGLMLGAAKAYVGDDGVQVLYDVMSAMGEVADPDAVEWCLSLLSHPSDRIFTGSLIGLENMVSVTTDSSWLPLALRRTGEALLDAASDTERARQLSHVIRLLKATGLTPDIETAAKRRLTATTYAKTLPQAGDGRHWQTCRRLSSEIAEALHVDEQRLLTRLLFDIAYGPHETVAIGTAILISCVPSLAALCGDALAVLAQDDDPEIRAHVGRRLYGAQLGTLPVAATAWLDGPEDLTVAGLMLYGNAGKPVPRPILQTAVRSETMRSAALYAAGMTQDLYLQDLVQAENTPRDVRDAATWWLRQGGRLT